MAVRVMVDADISEVKLSLQGLETYTKWLDSDILRALGTGAARQVKKEYPFKKRTGALYRSVGAHFAKGKKAIVISAPATDPRNSQRYGFILARGATIRPKNGKTLTFDTLGKWMRKHEVVIPGRDWIAGPAKSWVESEKDATIQKVIDKTLARLEKKGIIKR